LVRKLVSAYESTRRQKVEQHRQRSTGSVYGNVSCQSDEVVIPACRRFEFLLVQFWLQNFKTSLYDTVSILKGSDEGVLHLKQSGFWTLSIVQCFLRNATFRKLNLFPSSGKMKVAPTLLGPLERASLSHWTTPGRRLIWCYHTGVLG
jgi:hypothetical protein